MPLAGPKRRVPHPQPDTAGEQSSKTQSKSPPRAGAFPAIWHRGASAPSVLLWHWFTLMQRTQDREFSTFSKPLVLMSPRQRVALIQTHEGSRKLWNRAGRFVAPPCITNRSFYGVKVPVSSEEKADSARITPAPRRRSRLSTKTAGSSVHLKFF